MNSGASRANRRLFHSARSSFVRKYASGDCDQSSSICVRAMPAAASRSNDDAEGKPFPRARGERCSAAAGSGRDHPFLAEPSAWARAGLAAAALLGHRAVGLQDDEVLLAIDSLERRGIARGARGRAP